MTAATMTRTNRRSAFPTTVEELTPLARDYAAELGTTPSRNQLMKRFKVGDKKAKDLLAALATDVPTEPAPPALLTPAPAAPTAPEPVEPPPVALVTDSAGDAEPVDIGGVIASLDDTIARLTAERADDSPGPVDAVAEPAEQAAEVGAPVRRPVTWPVLILCLPAFVAIWAGWVEMGRLTGFGKVTLLPGITDFQIDTAITLPIGVETYAAYALWVWLSGRVTGDARAFAKWSAIGSLGLGALGQVAYHLMAAAEWTSAPWPITAAVSCIPVAVLGMGAALAHLMHQNH